MKRIHYLLIGAVCCTTLAALYGIYRGFLYCVTPQRCTVQSDAIAAPYLHDHFEQDCFALVSQKSSHLLLQTIVSSMESCKEVLCKRYPFGAYLRLKSAQPRARINGTLILTEQGKLVLAHEYREQALLGLPALKVVDTLVVEHYATADIVQFVDRMPLEFFEKYTVVWHDKTHIEATPKTIPLFTIIMTSETVWNDVVQKKLETIIHQPSRSQNKNHKKAIAWNVDVRFPGQIIRMPVQGGIS